MRRSGGVLVFVLCLVVVGLIGMATRTAGTVTRWYDGDRDAVITTPDYDVRILGVELAQSVVNDDEEFTTPGVFVVVEWSVAAKRQSAAFTKVRLETRDGISFEQRDEFLTDAGIPRTQPGFTSTGTSVFQIMPEQLDGVVMTIQRSQGVLFTHGAGARFRNVVDPGAPVRDSVTLRAQSVEVTR